MGDGVAYHDHVHPSQQGQLGQLDQDGAVDGPLIWAMPRTASQGAFADAYAATGAPWAFQGASEPSPGQTSLSHPPAHAPPPLPDGFEGHAELAFGHNDVPAHHAYASMSSPATDAQLVQMLPWAYAPPYPIPFQSGQDATQPFPGVSMGDTNRTVHAARAGRAMSFAAPAAPASVAPRGPRRRSTIARKGSYSSIATHNSDAEEEDDDNMANDDDYLDDMEALNEGGTRRRRLRRNRVAASRCRKKKKAASDDLADTERRLEAEHAQLSANATALREEVLGLKHEILRHASCNFDLISEYLQAEARRVHDRSRFDALGPHH